VLIFLAFVCSCARTHETFFNVFSLKRRKTINLKSASCTRKTTAPRHGKPRNKNNGTTTEGETDKKLHVEKQKEALPTSRGSGWPSHAWMDMVLLTPAQGSSRQPPPEKLAKSRKWRAVLQMCYSTPPTPGNASSKPLPVPPNPTNPLRTSSAIFLPSVSPSQPPGFRVCPPVPAEESKLAPSTPSRQVFPPLFFVQSFFGSNFVRTRNMPANNSRSLAVHNSCTQMDFKCRRGKRRREK